MSGLFRLNFTDLVKGAVVAIFAAVFPVVQSSLSSGGVIDWTDVGKLALAAFLGYLGKQLLTDENGKLGGKL